MTPRRSPHGPTRSAGAAAASRALVILAQAERRGTRLALAAHDPLSHRLRDWVTATRPLCELEREPAEWLLAALFEACANVAEHGYGGGEGRMELWWLPADADACGTALEQVANGTFVLRDDARAYAPRIWRRSDFGDARARRRGRGIGLDILHRAMRVVAFHPATTRGNVTLLRFGPDPDRGTRGAAA